MNIRKIYSHNLNFFYFRDELDAIRDAYGVAEGSEPFKYEEAKPRGWQEDRKDFTHKVIRFCQIKALSMKIIFPFYNNIVIQFIE